jgi:hypothetical protein
MEMVTEAEALVGVVATLIVGVFIGYLIRVLKETNIDGDFILVEEWYRNKIGMLVSKFHEIEPEEYINLEKTAEAICVGFKDDD